MRFHVPDAPSGDADVTRAATELRRQIATGELSPGDRLPTYAELGAQIDVSRADLREALVWLCERELARLACGVYVVRGATEPSERPRIFEGAALLGLAGFERVWNLRRVVVIDGRTMRLRTVVPDAEVLATLATAPGARGVRLERLRPENGARVAHAQRDLRLDEERISAREPHGAAAVTEVALDWLMDISPVARIVQHVIAARISGQIGPGAVVRAQSLAVVFDVSVPTAAQALRHLCTTNDLVKSRGVFIDARGPVTDDRATTDTHPRLAATQAVQRCVADGRLRPGELLPSPEAFGELLGVPGYRPAATHLRPLCRTGLLEEGAPGVFAVRDPGREVVEISESEALARLTSPARAWLISSVQLRSERSLSMRLRLRGTTIVTTRGGLLPADAVRVDCLCRQRIPTIVRRGLPIDTAATDANAVVAVQVDAALDCAIDALPRLRVIDWVASRLGDKLPVGATLPATQAIAEHCRTTAATAQTALWELHAQGVLAPKATGTHRWIVRALEPSTTAR